MSKLHPTPGFKINYEAMDYDDVAAVEQAKNRKSYTKLNSRPPREILDLFDWKTDEVQTYSSQPTGARFKDLYYTSLDIGNDDEWEFERALGKGSFGCVALFRRRDLRTNAIKSEIAAKAFDMGETEIVNGAPWMAREAAFMAQTNATRRQQYLRLKNFKAYIREKQFRMYMEYCPYGDLERLRLRYKAYGRYLPELFLWHVFRDLVTGLKGLSSGKWRDTSDFNKWDRVEPSSFAIHGDIKPRNIMLGQELDKAANKDSYPVPKFADFGLSRATGPQASGNKASRFRNGTRLFLPPEILYSELSLRKLSVPFRHPNSSRSNAYYYQGEHKISSTMNIWATACSMYMLMTLKEWPPYDEMRDVLQGRRGFNRDGTFLKDSELSTLQARRGEDYSRDLTDLVKQCLSINPHYRPKADELLQRCEDGYARAYDRAERKYGSSRMARATRVAYQRNEIDDFDWAVPGYRFDYGDGDGSEASKRWWRDTFMADLTFVPKAWGTLMPDNFPDSVSLPKWWPPTMQDGWGKEYKKARERQGRHR